MPPTLSVRLPGNLWPQIELALRNLAVWLQADLRVAPDPSRTTCVSFTAGETAVDLPAPDLDRWQREAFEIVTWREGALPQLPGWSGPVPDLLGLLHGLFHDVEELRQERAFPGERYDIRRSRLAPLRETNYLDRALREVFGPLLPQARARGVVLTHDLDILSRRGLAGHPWRPREALHRAMLGLRRGQLRDGLFYLASFYELTKTAGSGGGSPFEFLDWAAREEAMGCRSVFFVFTPERKRTFPDDASYTFSQRNARRPRITLREALAGLIAKGFLVEPHLSRSARYRREEIFREFDSLAHEFGTTVSATRNHWLWMRYSDWYEILAEAGVLFDFNQATIGYPKGTAAPHFSTNGRTLVFPTTFMDDAVLKSDRAGLSPRKALELLSSQLDELDRAGGCIALSFHPAEDAARETGGRLDKLKLYGEVLAEIARRRIPVYLPGEAKAVFDRQVTVGG